MESLPMGMSTTKSEKPAVDVYHVHNKIREADCAMKELEANCFRNVSCSQEDVDDSRAELALERRQLEREKDDLENDRKTFSSALNSYFNQVVHMEQTNIQKIGCSETSSNEYVLNIGEINPTNLTNAMFGEGNTQFNFGVQSEDIEHIKHSLTAMMTNIETDQRNDLLPQMREDLSKLLVKVESLQEEIQRSYKLFEEERTKLKTQIIYNKTLQGNNQKLQTKLQEEKKKNTTTISEEIKISDKPEEQHIQDDEETVGDQAPKINNSFLEWFEKIDLLKNTLQKSEQERQTLQDHLNKKRQELRETDAREYRLLQIIREKTEEQEEIYSPFYVDILEYMKQEHYRLKHEITTMSEERKTKDTFLQMSLDESIKNEAFLKEQNKNLEDRAENARQRLVQSSETCKDVKEELARLQNTLQMQKNATFEARSKLSHIVSHLQQFTGFQHGNKGRIRDVDEEQIKTHLKQFISEHQKEITEFEKVVQNQKEFMEDQKQRICDYRKTVTQMRINTEFTRETLEISWLKNLMLSENLLETQTKVKSLQDELQQSERERLELESYIFKCVERIRNLETYIEERSKELQRQQQQIKELEQNIDENEQQIREYQQNIKEDEQRIIEYKQRLDVKKEQVETYKQFLDGYLHKIDELSKNLSRDQHEQTRRHIQDERLELEKINRRFDRKDFYLGFIVPIMKVKQL